MSVNILLGIDSFIYFPLLIVVCEGTGYFLIDFIGVFSTFLAYFNAIALEWAVVRLGRQISLLFDYSP